MTLSQHLSILQSSLSEERLAPYKAYVEQNISNAYVDGEQKQVVLEDVAKKTVQLYVWNIHISAAFLELTQLYEVTLRNAILKAIDDKYPVYGIQDKAFIRSIPKNSQKEINGLIKNGGVSNGKVIAGLTFYFWETILKHMFCYDDKASKDKFPLLYKQKSKLSQSATDEDIKKLVDVANTFRNKIRNRICHHEPIYRSDLNGIYNEVMWSIEKFAPDLFLLIKKGNLLSIVEQLRNKPEI